MRKEERRMKVMKKMKTNAMQMMRSNAGKVQAAKENMISALTRFVKEEDGIGTVEMILILVVLISLVIIFKEQLTQLVNDIFSQITSKSSSIY